MRRGENVEEVQGKSRLLAEAGNAGEGVREGAERVVITLLALASPMLRGSLLRSLPVLTSTSLEGRNIFLQPLHPQIFRTGRSGICFVNAACNKEPHSGRQTAACLLIGRGRGRSLLGGPRTQFWKGESLPSACLGLAPHSGTIGQVHISRKVSHLEPSLG